MQAFIRQPEGNLEWMNATYPQVFWKEVKNKYRVSSVLPQSIIQNMQEGVRSSYNTKIQLRGRFKATSRRVTQEFLLGPVPFLKNAHVVCVCVWGGGGWVYGLFSPDLKDIPNPNFTEKRHFYTCC